MVIAFNEDDRIEHIHGYSHCRCRNETLSNGDFSCQRFKLPLKIKFRKLNLPDEQQCCYNSSSGYCELSRINEIELINSIVKSGLITDRLKTIPVTTRQGINLLKKMGIKNECTN